MTNTWEALFDVVALKPLPARVGLFGALALGSLFQGQPALAATDISHRCVNDADIRLIEILFSNADSVPVCKVVYRPESESDTLGIVSWQDLENEAACKAQANEVVDRLTGEGWACSRIGKAATVTALDRPDAEGADVQGPAASEDAAPSLLTAPAVIEDEVDPPARLIANPDLTPPTAELAALIKADLDNLDTKLDGRLEAMIAGYGDLNADEIEDVLVLYTYRSQKPAYRQFLAAYMHDGEAYQLTATKPIGGYASGTMDARVETIDRGVVHLELQAFEPGDADCCPSGTRHLALALSDLDFVEIDADGPTR